MFHLHSLSSITFNASAVCREQSHAVDGLMVCTTGFLSSHQFLISHSHFSLPRRQLEHQGQRIKGVAFRLCITPFKLTTGSVHMTDHLACAVRVNTPRLRCMYCAMVVGLEWAELNAVWDLLQLFSKIAKFSKMAAS
eukprot:scaffold3116_cov85-Cyclotella_meneghiniana.AAC.1